MKIKILEEKDEGKVTLKNKILVISKSQLKSVFDSKKDKAVIEGLSLISGNKLEKIGDAYLGTFHMMMLEPNTKESRLEKIAIYSDFQTFSVYVTASKHLLAEKLEKHAIDEEFHANLLIKLLNELTENDHLKLETMETELNNFENKIIKDKNPENHVAKIRSYKRILTKYKHHYDQLTYIIDFFAANSSFVTTTEDLDTFYILKKRVPKLHNQIVYLKETLSQIQDVYHSQIGIKQNRLMKIFTIITVVFMPLQLLVGWYGMNFKMPEFTWAWSYPIVAGVSVIALIATLIILAKKKWFD